MRATVVLMATMVMACGRSDAGRTDSATSAAAAGPIDSATIILGDFQRLRWLEGRWRGFMPAGGKFYESYRFLDDSTLVMHGYPDSTFAAAKDSSRIVLRRGTVANESASGRRYVATRLDSTGVDFAPHRGATNYFSWTRVDSTKWDATLRWTGAQGRPQTVVYALHRFGR